jgi:hypothetical protein
MHDVEQWIKDRHDESASARDKLKSRIFEELAKTEAVTVDIQYNGSGDSGDIEHVIARDANGDEIELIGPQCIESQENYSQFDGEKWATVKRDKLISLGEALEEFAYHALEARHPGWEINEGAYGNLELDVKKKTVTMKHNTIIQETEYSEDEL